MLTRKTRARAANEGACKQEFIGVQRISIFHGFVEFTGGDVIKACFRGVFLLVYQP